MIGRYLKTIIFFIVITTPLLKAQEIVVLNTFLQPVFSVHAGNDVQYCLGTSGIVIGSDTAGWNGSSPYTYQWEPSLGLSSSIIANPIAAPNTPTLYTLTVIDAKGCMSKDSVFVNVETCTSSGIQSLTVSEIKLRTTSDKSFVFLDGQGIKGSIYLKIMDSCGRIILQESNNIFQDKWTLPVSVAYLQSGIYFLEMSGKSFRVVLKWVK